MGKVIVNVGFEEDSSVQDVIQHLSTVKEKMSDIEGNKPGISSVLEQLGLSEKGRQEMIDSITGAINSLSGLGTTLDAVPAHLMRSFSVLKSEVTGIENLLNNVSSKQKGIIQDSTKSLQNVQQLMMSFAGMKSQSENIKTFSSAFKSATKNEIGWSANDLAKFAPSVMSMVLEPAVRKILSANKQLKID